MCLPQALPREMVFSHTLDPSRLHQVWCPAEPTDAPEVPPASK
jgi:hypothetical protein